MIPNNWNEILKDRGLMQSRFAESIGINKGTFSRVCSGRQLLDWDDFELCLLHLACTPWDIYPASILAAVYGCKRQTKKPAKKRTAKRVPMDESVAAQVDDLVEGGLFKNRAEAVELIVRKYLSEAANGTV